MSYAVIITYFGTLGLLALIGVHRIWAVVAARRYRAQAGPPLDDWPCVLVQVPLYNEAFVAERAIRAAAALRYPRDRLWIQILDDSTDRTRAVVDHTVQQLRETDVEVHVVRRGDRSGFKAGALAHGLERCPDVDLVAIFDADFLPGPGFLEAMAPILLQSPDLGLVQARWGHLNRDASSLTRAQAVFLDGHFAIEHAARDASGHMFNFNGTAGLWRRQAVEEAGGWQGDTITEDLDLSYRAQLAGWRFAYAHDVVAPAELPESWAAFRAQQARWVRGSVQTALKLGAKVARSRRHPLAVRLDGLVHLTNNFAYLGMAVLAALLPATLVLREELGWEVPGGRWLLSGLDVAMLAAGTSAMVVFYFAALRRAGERSFARAFDVLLALCLGAGMSLSNAFEVLRGLSGSDASFVRTPKKGEGSRGGGYRARSVPLIIGLELVLTAYYAAGVGYAVIWQVWGALPFMLVYLLGFGAVGARSALEAIVDRSSRSSVSSVELPAFETRRG